MSHAVVTTEAPAAPILLALYIDHGVAVLYIDRGVAGRPAAIAALQLAADLLNPSPPRGRGRP